MFIRFDRMHERDTHTHTHRQAPHDGTGRACIASRGKKYIKYSTSASVKLTQTRHSHSK